MTEGEQEIMALGPGTLQGWIVLQGMCFLSLSSNLYQTNAYLPSAKPGCGTQSEGAKGGDCVHPITGDAAWDAAGSGLLTRTWAW